MVADPPALLPRLARDHTDDGRTIVGIGPVSFLLVGTSPGWIRGVKMGRAFFPPRSGTVHRPQRPCQTSPRSGRSRSGWPWMRCRRVWSCFRDPSQPAARRAVDSPLAIPRRNRTKRRGSLPRLCEDGPGQQGIIALAGPTAGGRKVALGTEQRAVSARPQGGHIKPTASGGDVPARSCKYCHPGARRWGSLTWGDDITLSTVATHEPISLQLIPCRRSERTVGHSSADRVINSTWGWTP